MTEIEVTPSDTYLNRARELEANLPDWVEHIPARDPDPEEDTPVPLAFHLDLPADAFFWISPDKEELFVGASLAGDLQTVEVPRLPADRTVEVGRIKEPVLEHNSPGDIVLFLICAGIIQTFFHVGSNLTRTREQNEDGSYTARFDGTHTFYTSERTTNPVQFRVELNLENGKICVTGLEVL